MNIAWVEGNNYGYAWVIAAFIFSLLAYSEAQGAQTTIQLNYNFNGMVHTGEAGQPDAPNGFRSISDRAMIIDGGPSSFNDLTSPNSNLTYSIVHSPGVLDIVHIGNRNTVANGAYPFDTVANGDNIGVQPTWLPDPNQTTAVTTINPGIVLDNNSKIGFLYNISNAGGDFDVTLHFADGGSVTVTLNGPDWFGPFNGQPDAPGAGVKLQQNIGQFTGSQDVDMANPGPPLIVTEAVISAGKLLSDLSFNVLGRTLTGITFGNQSNPSGGYEVFAATVTTSTNASVSVPTMTEWGMLIFMVVAGFGALYYLRAKTGPRENGTAV